MRLGLPLGIVYVVLARPGPHALEIGGAIALVGLGLRAVSAGHLRKNAALALGEVGPAAEIAVPALVAALGDRDERVRRPVADALGQIGPNAREAIRLYLEDVIASGEPIPEERGRPELAEVEV